MAEVLGLSRATRRARDVQGPMERTARSTKVLTIDRTKWLRGDSLDSCLLDSNTGTMCCLGFFGLKVGMSSEAICDKARPDELPGDPAELVSQWKHLLKPSGADVAATRLCERLMSANDAERLSEWRRENRIARLFAQIGWRVRFVKGKKPPSVLERNDTYNATGASSNG